MMRFLLRTLGFVLLAVAFAALVVDGSRSIAGGRVLFSSLGDAAVWLGGTRLGGTAAAWPEPARSAAALALAAPAFVLAGLLGLLLLHLGRPPAAGVGFSGRRA